MVLGHWLFDFYAVIMVLIFCHTNGQHFYWTFLEESDISTETDIDGLSGLKVHEKGYQEKAIEFLVIKDI